MAQKDVGNKVPIYKLKKTEEVMKYYDEWGEGNKYDKDMVDWNYTGPKETSEVFNKHAKDKTIKIFDAGCGTGLVGVELKKFGFSNFYGADLSQTLLDLVPEGLYKSLEKVDLNKRINTRYFPTSPLQPNFSPIPSATRYQRFQVSTEKMDTTGMNKYPEFKTEKTFYPGTSKAPVQTVLNNVDVESKLRN